MANLEHYVCDRGDIKVEALDIAAHAGEPLTTLDRRGVIHATGDLRNLNVPQTACACS